jgi:hypothetical protein
MSSFFFVVKKAAAKSKLIEASEPHLASEMGKKIKVRFHFHVQKRTRGFDTVGRRRSDSDNHQHVRSAGGWYWFVLREKYC